MNKVTRRKYVIIPDFKPLYAAKKCFAPDHGPLSNPTPMPVDIIRELLLQSGKEKLTIYEVVIDPVTRRSSEPVLLTLDNYLLPYEEIVGQPVTDGTLVKEPTPPPAEPIKVPTDPKPNEDEGQKENEGENPGSSEDGQDDPAKENDEDTPAVPTGTEPEADTSAEAEVAVTVTKADDASEASDEQVTEDPKPEESSNETPAAGEPEAEDDGGDKEAENEGAPAAPADPYAGMTKAERKAARRAAAQGQKANEG